MDCVLLIFGAPSLKPDSKEISIMQQRCSERQLSSSSGASHWARIEPVNVTKKVAGEEMGGMFPCGSVVCIAGTQNGIEIRPRWPDGGRGIAAFFAKNVSVIRIIRVSYLDATLCFENSAYSVRRQHQAIEDTGNGCDNRVSLEHADVLTMLPIRPIRESTRTPRVDDSINDNTVILFVFSPAKVKR